MYLLPVPNYEGLYEVSDTGRVWASAKYITRKAWNSDKTHQIFRERREISPKKRGAYLAVVLYDADGNKQNHSIHRLVAQAFLPNEQHLPQVNHKDENKYNNSKDNLEWCTAQYNQVHSKSVERVFVSPAGEVVSIQNVNQFAKDYSLNIGCVRRLISGGQHQTKGWKLYSFID